ncbi:MAG: hypothetical protein WBV82_25975 [Myxococcaceae bacterium]
MESDREQIRRLVSEAADGRPTRWANEGATLVGDFDGRDWTLEVFDVPSENEHALFLQLSGIFRDVSSRFGTSLMVVTHPPEHVAQGSP